MSDDTIINPLTQRRIKVGGVVYNKLVEGGHIIPVTSVQSAPYVHLHFAADDASPPRKEPTSGEKEIKKTVVVSKRPIVASKASKSSPSAEQAVKKRDPALHKAFKQYLKTVPDVRRFETDAMKKAIESWTDTAKWQELLDELQQLDALAVPDVKNVSEQNDDVRFVEWMNALDPESYELRRIYDEPEGDMLARVWSYDRSDYYNVAGFVTRYPVLAWLMTRLNPHFRLHALRAHPPYLDWIDGATFQWREPEEYAPYVTDERLLGVLLDDIKLKNYRDYPLGDNMRTVSERKNIAYLRYVVKRVVPHSGLLRYFIRAGDVDTVKLAISRMSPADQTNIKQRSGKGEIGVAIESGSVPMLQFVEKEFGVKATEKDFSRELTNLILAGEYTMIDEMLKRGYPIFLDDLIMAVRTGANGEHSLTLQMFNYLVKVGGFEVADIVKRVEPLYKDPKRTMHDESVFIVSVASPIPVTRHILETYGKNATEQDWNDLLTYHIESFRSSPDEDDEHSALLFSSHNYSAEQKKQWEERVHRDKKQ